MMKIVGDEEIKRNYLLGCLYLISGIILFFTILLWPVIMRPLDIILCSLLVFHLALIFMLKRLQLASIQVLIPVYIIVITILLLPMAILVWMAKSLSGFIWYLVLPFAISGFYSSRDIAKWCIYIFVLLTSSLVFVELNDYYFQISVIGKFLVAEDVSLGSHLPSPALIYDISQIFSLIFAFTLSAYFVYYLNKFHYFTKQQQMDKYSPTLTKPSVDVRNENVRQKEKFERNELEENVLNEEIFSEEQEDENDEKEKYVDLYTKIVDFLERKRPYTDPNYTISKLAADLKTNPTYISKAIKQKQNVHFSLFINGYRVENIKRMISQNYHNRFTLRYIYTSSGFKNQATFNKAFKQSEGITPSQYYHKMNIKKN
ncbi:MAG: helix-turn-helix domain-containing protein [Bacteroidales bacterium]|jgi:AraC-like DNA-binding protein|nr:helix-turn-helix domain-containing protein [Bacteroidales bacterium]